MDKIRDQEIYARQNANISTKTMKGKKNEENKDFENYIIEIPNIKEFENLCLPLSVITAALLEKGKILKEQVSLHQLPCSNLKHLTKYLKLVIWRHLKL